MTSHHTGAPRIAQHVSTSSLIDQAHATNKWHTATCRARLTEAIASTPHGGERLQKFTERKDKYLAEHVRQHTEDGGAQAQGWISGAAATDAPEIVSPPYDLTPLVPTEPKVLA